MSRLLTNYEVENSGQSSQIIRITLSIAGQSVAQRVVTSSSSTYYYLFTDHLGSIVLMGIQNSGKNQLEEVAYSRACYYPFGDYRGTPPNQTLTDRGFTSQKSNNQPSADLGLLYYNARYYLPAIGKFTSADTIVPDPANPQQFNRYAYTLNNPVRFTDPSGHRTCTAQQAAAGDETCDQNIDNNTPTYYDGPIVTDFELYVLLSELTGQDYVGACYGAGGVICSPSELELSRLYLFEDFDLQLTIGDTLDLIHELDWWIEQLGYAEDGATIASLIGVFVGGVGLVSANPLFVGGGMVVAIGGATIDWTNDDLKAIREELRVASGDGQNGVRITVGSDYTNWGVFINGAEIINHSLFGLKGNLNLTYTWLLVWYWGDYQGQ